MQKYKKTSGQPIIVERKRWDGILKQLNKGNGVALIIFMFRTFL